MGDATNLVIVFTGELLKMAENLIRMGGLQPSDIIQGYEKAQTYAQKVLEGRKISSLRSMNLAKALIILRKMLTESLNFTLELSHDTIKDIRSQAELTKALSTVIASKQYGNEEILSELVAEAVLAVLPKNPEHFNVDNIRVVKIMGSGLGQSKVVKGMVFAREPEGSGTNLQISFASPSLPRLIFLDYH